MIGPPRLATRLAAAFEDASQDVALAAQAARDAGERRDRRAEREAAEEYLAALGLRARLGRRLDALAAQSGMASGTTGRKEE